MPLGKEVGFGLGHIVLDGDSVATQCPLQQPLPTLWLMSIVAKRSPISATAELLLGLAGPGGLLGFAVKWISKFHSKGGAITFCILPILYSFSVTLCFRVRVSVRARVIIT